MAKNAVYVGIAVLAVIAVVLGYKIYQQTVVNKAIPATQQTQDRTTPQSVGKSPQPQSQQPLPAEISENNILQSFPGPSSTPEETKRFFDAVDKLSKTTSALNITECKLNPLVFKVKKGNSMQVTNDNTSEHYLKIDSQHQYKIPAKSTQTINTNLGVGAFGYGCGGIDFETQSVVGIIYITD